MYIEGCILPVPFNNLTSSGFRKGQAVVQTESLALMGQIKDRYELLKNKNEYKNAGNAALVIAAVLPTKLMPEKATTDV